jgi:hypothetical protein
MVIRKIEYREKKHKVLTTTIYYDKKDLNTSPLVYLGSKSDPINRLPHSF